MPDTEKKTRSITEEAEKSGFQEQLRAGLTSVGERLQAEAKGVETRIKEGVQSAVEEGKHPEKRFGRPPSRHPPSGRPPSVS